MKTEVLLILNLLVSSIIYSGEPKENKIVEQIKIPLGNRDYEITLIPGLYAPNISAMDVDEEGNIYVSESIDSNTVIKKYSKKGEYLGKIFLRNIALKHFVIFKYKLYALHRVYKNNDFYTFSIKDYNLIDIRKNVFTGVLAYDIMESFNNKVAFNIANKYFNQKDRFVVYDLETGTFTFDLDSPYPSEDRDLLDNKTTFFHTKTSQILNIYLGKIKNSYLFYKPDINEENYTIIIFTRNKNGNIETKSFTISGVGKLLDGFTSEHWRLKKDNCLYFLGWKEMYIVVNKIDLKRIFPELYFDTFSKAANK